MERIHEVVHGVASGAGPFLGWMVAFSVGALAVALLLARRLPRLSGRSRHFLLSAGYAAPLVVLLLLGTGAVEAARGWFPEPAAVDAGAAVATELGFAVPSPRQPSHALCALLMLWAAGASIALGLIGRDWVRWRGVARRSREIAGSELPGFEAACGRAGVRVRVALSDETPDPLLIGVATPRVLVPASWADRLSEPELSSVFVHELAHVKRRDNLSAVVQALIWSLFWFDPLRWIARRRLLDLRERACDEWVLEHGCEPDRYVDALAKTSHATVRSAAVACMSGFRIRERIDSIMSYSDRRPTHLSHASVRTFAAVALLGAAALFAAAAPPPALLAAPSPGERHRLVAVAIPRPDGMMQIRVEVRTPDGELVMANGSTIEAAKSIELVTFNRGRAYRVSVATNVDGSGTARLRVLEGEQTVDELVLVMVPPLEERLRRAAPIDLSLVNADLHDVLRTFSQISGRRIVADPSIRGRVTIEVKQTPWVSALAQAIEPLGLRIETRGEEIHVVAGPLRSSKPLPEGVRRVDGVSV
ncbi:MAG TPA: M56 family metallopeptidase, partial [Longimicrobiaceae bacterium]|nr:M56 family metallopeptidase [Longimicrobiaceae bacterium]